MQPWEVFNSRKICQVTYARLQGIDALKEHFKNSKFACDNDDYMPVVFDPSRDGRQLTDPAPIAGRVGSRLAVDFSDTGVDRQVDCGEASSTTTSTHAPSDHADCAEEDDDGDDVAGSSGCGGGDGDRDGDGDETGVAQ